MDPTWRGDVLTYTVTITNNGPSDSQPVAFSDTLPSDTTFLSVSAPGSACTETAGELECSPGPLRASASIDIIVEVDVNLDAADLITNTAAAISITPDPTLDNNLVELTTMVEDLVIELGDNRQSSYELALVARDGNTWTYRVTELSGRDLSHWSLGIASCFDNIMTLDPSKADIGHNAQQGFEGVKWDTKSKFNTGEFVVTLDDTYPKEKVPVLVKAGNIYAIAAIPGPTCPTD